MSVTYADFLAAKQRRVPALGVACTPDDVHPFLHGWQREIVAWAVEQGRAALWEDTGLGKTVQQVEWARLSADTSLIIAPLAVCQQTVREAAKVGVTARYVRDGAQVTGPGVWVTNYEMADRFDYTRIGAVVLDESSVLKDVTTKTRDLLIRLHRDVPRRLACSATPAPNDPAELCNQAEWLGVSTRREMLSTYFVHDSDMGWRVKRHARRPMFAWMASWAVALRSPADLGWPDHGYQLPPLQVIQHLLDVDVAPDGQLFATDLGGVGGRASIRRQTLAARCEKVAELVTAEPDEPWLLWCGLNAEADELVRLLPGVVDVRGSMTPEQKADAFLAFADGGVRWLLTKPSIASLGMNWQHCARMTFVGMNDSFESYYQAIRRCWRYGQTRPVHAHVVLSELEGRIAANVAAKEREHTAMTAGLVAEIAAARGTG